MVAAVFADLAPKRALDPWELQDLRDVVDAAEEWAAGRLPLSELVKVGHIEWQGRPSSGYTRFLALLTVGPRSSQGQTLLRAIEAIVGADRRIRVTDGGCISAADYIDTLGSRW